MRIIVTNSLNSKKYEVDGDPNETVDSLFNKIKALTGPLSSLCYLQFGSTPLNSNQILRDINLQEGSHLVIMKSSSHGYASYTQTTIPQISSPNSQFIQPQNFRKKEYIIPWLNPKILEPTPPSTTYFRFSTLAFPRTNQMYQQASVPLGVVVRPADISNQTVIDSTGSSLIKCKSCGCMLCPQVTFSPDYRNWICPACQTPNEIRNSQRIIGAAELHQPVYDIIAPAFTNSFRIGGACFTFLIDLSAPAFAINFTSQFIYSIKASLPSMPDTVQVNLMTTSDVISYFDFSTATEVIIPDLADIVSNPPKSFYLGDVRDLLNAALDNLLVRNGENNSKGHCIGDAIKYAIELMPNGGNLIVGFVGLPQFGHVLADRTLDKENNEAILLKLPKDTTAQFYRRLPFLLSNCGISLHVFHAGKQYSDLSTDAVATGLTGGSCQHYHNFDQEDRMKLHNDVFKILTKQYLWDASLAVKTNPGLKLRRAHGNCVAKSSGGKNASFAVLQTDDSLVLEIDFQEDQKVVGSNVFVQMQLFFTNDEKQQIVRVFSFSVPFADNVEQIINNIDEAALLGIIIRKATTSVLSDGGPASAKFLLEVTKTLAEKHMPLVSLPYLIHSMLCTDLVSPQHPEGVDGRLALVIKIRSIDIINLILYLYPRFFVLTETGETYILPLTGSSFSTGSCFIVHCIDKIIVWVSTNASPQFLADVFGVSDLTQIAPEVPETGGPLNNKLFELVNESRILSGCYLPVIAIPQGSPSESIFQNILVDDKKGYNMNFQEYANSL